MIRRRAGLLIAIACAGLLLSGCDGSPKPEPSTSAPLFAGEAEAFAAAEATYRAYVDAVNERRESGAERGSPTEFLTGTALEAEIAGQEQLDQMGVRVVGETAITAFIGAESTATTVDAVACVDASNTRVFDSAGVDVTPPDREPESAFQVAFVVAGERLLIAMNEPTGLTACDS